MKKINRQEQENHSPSAAPGRKKPVYRTGIREPAARLFLRRMEKRTPDRVRTLVIQTLLDATADAFGEPSKRIRNLPPEQALQEYAACTRQWSQKEDADPRRIYRTAYRLGQRIRVVTGLTDEEDLQRLVFWLYRNIGITMNGNLPGEIVVSACFFSAFYSPAQCRLMSAMDAGVTAGIFGGGKLTFTERITQGCACCRACFRK